MAKNYDRQSWATFHSPFEVEKINPGSNNILLDWKRGANTITIDGIKVAFLLAQDSKENSFESQDTLKAFFKKYLLKNITDEDVMEEAIDYLMARLHQGGLLHPVSAAAVEALSKIQGKKLNARNEDTIRVVAFVTTESGFKVQETYSLKSVTDFDATEEDKRIIQADKKDQPLLKAQATIHVNFLENPDKRLTVESTSISYGNKMIQKFLDKRNFLQRIIDYISTIIGLNETADLSSIRPKV